MTSTQAASGALAEAESGAQASNTAGSPRKSLSVFDAVMIVTGIVIGSGIFAFPQMVAGTTGTVGWMFTAWLLGAALSLLGALCYAELSSAFPSAGGDYYFITRAYGRNVSFFFAWARVTVITTGTMALGGFVLGDYLTQTVLSLGPASSAIYAGLTIIVLTAVNIAGLRESSRTQNLMTLLLVAGMSTVVLAGALAPAGGALPVVGNATTFTSGVPPLLPVALMFVLFTFGGWNEAAYISAEVKGGRRAIVVALVLAIALVTAVYLAFVWALLNGLGLDGLKNSKTPAVDVARAAFGPLAEVLVGSVAALAALTTVNATAIVGARSNFALGRDWPSLSFMSTWNNGRDAPVKAFLVQGGIALLLVVLAAFQKSGVAAMVEFTAPVFWFFFLMTGVALFVLRMREPNVSRPFKVPLYPIVPILFCCTCTFLLWNSLKWALQNSSVQVSLLVMGAGVIAWLFARRGHRAAA